MNQQIKALMLEAGYAAPELAVRAQKLAELVVQKCCTIVEVAALMRAPASTYASKIQQRFKE